MAVVITALTQASAEASCWCEVPGITVLYTRSEAVFIGKAESVVREADEPKPIERDPSTRKELRLKSLGSGTLRRRTTLSVSTVYKGPAMKSFVVEHDGSRCGQHFKIGETYLIYATKLTGPEAVDKCTRVVLKSEAAADLAYLESGRNGRPIGLIEGQVWWRTADGNLGLSAAPLDIVVTGGGRSYSMRTEWGRFTFGLAAGEYEIQVMQKNTPLVPATRVVVRNGDTVKPSLIVETSLPE